MRSLHPGPLERVKNKLSLYFYYTARPEPLNPLNHLRNRNRRAGEDRIRSIDGGALYRLLDEVIGKSGSTGCDFSDYWTIWTTLERLSPRCILECGSGVSSVVFGYYAKRAAERGEAVKIVSVEESQHYHDNIVGIYPEDLKPHVEFVRRDRVEADYGGLRGCYYRDVPELDYDFVFIDGPVDRRVFNDKSYPKCFNADFLHVVARAGHPVSALLDQRITTLRALRKLIRSDGINYLPTRSMALFSNIAAADLVPVEITQLD